MPKMASKYYGLYFFDGIATQLVIIPPHILWIGQASGIQLLCYSMISFIRLVIFKYKREGWEQITFSLTKLTTIMHIACTSDNGNMMYFTNPLGSYGGKFALYTTKNIFLIDAPHP